MDKSTFSLSVVFLTARMSIGRPPCTPRNYSGNVGPIASLRRVHNAPNGHRLRLSNANHAVRLELTAVIRRRYHPSAFDVTVETGTRRRGRAKPRQLFPGSIIIEPAILCQASARQVTRAAINRELERQLALSGHGIRKFLTFQRRTKFEIRFPS